MGGVFLSHLYYYRETSGNKLKQSPFTDCGGGGDFVCGVKDTPDVIGKKRSILELDFIPRNVLIDQTRTG